MYFPFHIKNPMIINGGWVRASLQKNYITFLSILEHYQCFFELKSSQVSQWLWAQLELLCSTFFSFPKQGPDIFSTFRFLSSLTCGRLAQLQVFFFVFTTIVFFVRFTGRTAFENRKMSYSFHFPRLILVLACLHGLLCFHYMTVPTLACPSLNFIIFSIKSAFTVFSRIFFNLFITHSQQ